MSLEENKVQTKVSEIGPPLGGFVFHIHPVPWSHPNPGDRLSRSVLLTIRDTSAPPHTWPAHSFSLRVWNKLERVASLYLGGVNIWGETVNRTVSPAWIWFVWVWFSLSTFYPQKTHLHHDHRPRGVCILEGEARPREPLCREKWDTHQRELKGFPPMGQGRLWRMWTIMGFESWGLWNEWRHSIEGYTTRLVCVNWWS